MGNAALTFSGSWISETISYDSTAHMREIEAWQVTLSGRIDRG